MWVEGSRDGCSDSEIDYIIHDFPGNADYLTVEASSGNTVLWVDNNSKTFRIKFANSTDFQCYNFSESRNI